MEVISFHVSVHKRSDGTSAMGELRYIARERERDNRDDLMYLRAFTPKNAPKTYNTPHFMVSEFERIEKQKNARLYRSVRFSIPKEYDHETQINVAEKYIENTFVNKGMCAILAIHDKGDGNPHAHVILSLRSLDENGKWMNKQRKNYILDEDGNKIYDPIKRTYKCGRPIMTNDWDAEGNVEKWRRELAQAINRENDCLGIDRPFTHKSYKRQGINVQPTIHLGRKATEMERRGKRTERGDKNREILKVRERNEMEHHQQRERQRERDHQHSRSRSR